MLSHWPIRRKLIASSIVLGCAMLALSFSGFYGQYAYRQMVKELVYLDELRLASLLARRVGELRIEAVRLCAAQEADALEPAAGTFEEVRAARERFRQRLMDVREAVAWYHDRLVDDDERPPWIGSGERQRETLRGISAALERLEQANSDTAWVLDELRVGALRTESESLQELCRRLPARLHEDVAGFVASVRGGYRTLIIVAWISAVLAVGLLLILFWTLYGNVLRPLRVIVKGARKLAAGRFEQRIELPNRAEMSELAEAFNDMTSKFTAQRDRLNLQVQERTAQIVRTQRMAGVGFLAAGVSHEINNPLASIAMGAESLERRLSRRGDGDLTADDVQTFREYLGMIESEADRCAGITDKLFNFSHVGAARRQRTDLGELVQGTIAVLGHVGEYRRKRVEFTPRGRVAAEVDAEELKQVLLNLLTNALDSIAPDGRVAVELAQGEEQAMITVRDDGCGMTEEVRAHLFEPFFTRGKEGKGTGLGLAISERIVTSHGGRIDVESAGPGHGSTFRVRLPLRAVGERNARAA